MPLRQSPKNSRDASNAQLQMVLNAVAEGLCGLDAAGNVTFCNDALLRMTGYQTEETIGKNLHQLLHPKGLDGTANSAEECARRQAIADRQPIHNVSEICWRKDGTCFPTEFWSHALQPPSDLTERMVTIHDITERKRAEEKLLFESALLVAQSETTLDGILVVDGDGRIVRTNKQFAIMFGVPGEILSAGDDGDLLRHVTERVANPDAFKARVAHLYEHPEEKSRDEISLKDGKIFDRYSAPLIDSNGRNRGRIWYFRDITVRKTAERKLKLTQFSLEHASDAVHWVNRHGHIIYVNEAACSSLERSREELLTLSVWDVNAAFPREAWGPNWDELKARGAWTFESQQVSGTGKIFPVEVTANYREFDGQEYSFAFVRDITKRKQAEKELRLMQFSLEHASDDIHWVNSQGRIVYANRAACRTLGRSHEELLALSITDIDPLFTKETWRERWEDLRTRGSLTFETQHKTKDGQVFPVEITANYLAFDGQEYDFAFVRDITERKKAEEALQASEKRYRLLFERNLAGVFRTNLEGCVLDCNQAAAHMFGYDSPAQVLVIPIADFYEATFEREALLTKLKLKKSITNLEISFLRKDSSTGWAMANISLVDDDSNSSLAAIEGTLVDITERKVAEERVQSLAYFDALTGLPNRTLLRDRLSKALANARREKCKVALLFLDLDRFKTINDSLGHSVGDLLLQEVAERLKRCTREQDTVARLGGDEFLIVLTTVRDNPQAAVAAERFMDAMTADFVIQDHTLSVSCSLGISIFPEHGGDSETLIKNADAAMYGAKEGGRNNFQFFTADMNAQAVQRLTMENGLRLALEKKELFLVYQPQVEIATGKIVGFEALLRWQHPELGLVPPDAFIRIAENSGLIMPIGEWVLKTACAQARKWQDEGLTAVSMSVNVSAVQFRQEAFAKTICNVLRETGLAPHYLELELTESLLLSNADVMFSVLQQLTAMGLRLAIDDFGTGYSSLSYLKRFPVSKLKIDRSFIRDVAVNPDDGAITTAIISMAKSLNLKVIAEGVENEAQMSFLRAHHCDEIQGYYFSKPLTAEDAADKLRADHSEMLARAQAGGSQS